MKVMAQVHVEIPDDTSEDKIHDTLANKLRAGTFQRKDEYDFEVETDLLDTGWELQYTPTREQPISDEEHEGRCDAIAARREDHQRDE